MKSKEPSQEIDDILDEETVNFDTDDTDDDLYDASDDVCIENKKVHCSSDVNNIFPLQHNLHDKCNKIVLKQPIHGFREVSLSFSLFNINKILKLTNVAFKDVSSTIAKYGNHAPIYSNVEVERIVNSYVKCLQYSVDVSYVVTSFINMYKQGKVNHVISYYFTKANYKSKLNSNIVGVENIVCNFNADSYRELCFKVTPDNKKFNPLSDMELYMVEDSARIFWNLYMLLVFYKVCGIAPYNEHSFFEHFHNVINLALIAGMRMFVQLDLKCSYGELYQELLGIKPINGKYMSVDINHEHQQIYFRITNSDFLTEAYQKEYSGAVHIPYSILKTKNLKKDQHKDIQLWVIKGTSNNSLWIEVLFSGQHPIGRIYDCETDPETVINFINIFNYCPEALRPIMYLFKQVLNYSKDFGVTSYYTEIQKYLKQFKGKRTRGIVPKVLNVIIRILHDRPNKTEFNKILKKYFKDSDTKQTCEVKKIYNELQPLLKQKKVRAIDKLRKELEDYVW